MATWHDETKIVLELPFPIKSQNQFQGRHWTVKHRDRLEWAKVIRAITHRIPMQRLKASGPRSLIIIAPGYRTDLTNVIGGAKGFIDALVDYGMLIDDSPSHLCHVECWADKQKKMLVVLQEVVSDKRPEAKKYLEPPVQGEVESAG